MEEKLLLLLLLQRALNIPIHPGSVNKGQEKLTAITDRIIIK